MIVHGEQSFTHTRPLHAGDVVVAQSTIESIRRVGNMTTMTTVTEIRTVDGEHVCTPGPPWSSAARRGKDDCPG